MFIYDPLLSQSMTTIVGLTSSGPKAIILASDECNTTSFILKQKGGETQEQYRTECKKIVISEKNLFAAAACGVNDPALKEFMYRLANSDSQLNYTLLSKRFDALLELNGNRWDWKVPDSDNANSMLVASRFNNTPALYTCFPLGCVEPRDYTAIGSGSPYALQFISDNKPPRAINLDEAIELAIGSIEVAHKDPHTNGLDIVVVGPARIIPYGHVITQEVQKAKNEFTRKIKELARQDHA